MSADQTIPRPTLDTILGDAAPLWRDAMNSLHVFARASKCLPGTDVVQWFASETARIHEAMRPPQQQEREG